MTGPFPGAPAAVVTEIPVGYNKASTWRMDGFELSRARVAFDRAIVGGRVLGSRAARGAGLRVAEALMFPRRVMKQEEIARERTTTKITRWKVIKKQQRGMKKETEKRWSAYRARRSGGT